MKWNGKSHKAVIIVGAGASRGAVGHVVLNKKRIKPPLNGDFFSVAERFAAADPGNKALASRIERIKSVISEELPPARRGTPTMEEVFSLLYVTKDFPSIYSSKKGRKRSKKGRREVEDFLRLVFGVLTSIEQLAGSDTLYDRLAARLENEDVIISLNYDTLIERALWERGWDPAKGYDLQIGAQKIKWKKKGGETALSGVRVLKLHGSLNWNVKGSFSQLSKVFTAKPNEVVEPGKVNEHSGRVRQIIPPIYGKFFDHSHWERLWRKAYEAVLDADALIVIGCSLADTDFHLSGMLNKAAATRKVAGKTFSEVMVVNGRKKKSCRWKRLVRGCKSHFESMPSFEKMAKTYLQEEK